MNSHNFFTVPHIVKIYFFIFALLLISLLVGYQVNKRIFYKNLLLETIMDPLPIFNQIVPFIPVKNILNDSEIFLKDYHGQWVLVNFWASWCSSCIEEMPSLEMLARKMQNKMTVLTISVDDNQESIKNFFANKKKPSFHILWDNKLKLNQYFAINKYPESFLISPTGQIVAKFVGLRDWYKEASIQYFAEIVSGKRSPVTIL